MPSCLVLAIFSVVGALRMSDHASEDVRGIRKFGPSGGALLNLIQKNMPGEWESAPGCAKPAEEAISYSQGKEDMELYNAYFCNKKKGTFIEIGALDGLSLSNTKFFEDVMGWSGGLIEASPPNVLALKKNRGNGRAKIFGEATCPEGVGHIKFYADPVNDAMGSEQQIEVSNPNHAAHVVDVPCRPLSAMLREVLEHSQSDHIDFFSLDVEGAEFEVLKTMDWSIPVKVWVIEKNDGFEKVQALLTEHGYRKSRLSHLFSNPINEVWEHESM